MEAVNKRFNRIEFDPIFSIAASLDPRYKDRYFDEDVKQRAQATLDAKLMDRPAAGVGDGRESKRAHTNGEWSTLHDMFEEIVTQTGTNGTQIPECAVHQYGQ